MATLATSGRTRDPARCEWILLAAMSLAAAVASRRSDWSGGRNRRYGPIPYLSSKSELLVALVDRVVDQLVADAAAITAEIADPGEALNALILDHIDAELTDPKIFRAREGLPRVCPRRKRARSPKLRSARSSPRSTSMPYPASSSNRVAGGVGASGDPPGDRHTGGRSVGRRAG